MLTLEYLRRSNPSSSGNPEVGVSVARLGRAFCDVGVAIDYLKIWQAPVIEQLRPWRIPVFAPHPKQRDAVVNLGAVPQPSAGFAAASRLQAPQQPGLATRRIPELPCDYAGTVPDRILVGASAIKPSHNVANFDSR